MRVLLDTNIILDWFLDRKPHSKDAIQLIQKVETGVLVGYLCATTITTIHYLTAKVLGKETAREEIAKLLSLFDIAPVNRLVLEQALDSHLTDFEDAVLYESAIHHGAQAIITRNIKDFKKTKLPIYTAKQFLSLI